MASLSQLGRVYTTISQTGQTCQEIVELAQAMEGSGGARDGAASTLYSAGQRTQVVAADCDLVRRKERGLRSSPARAGAGAHVWVNGQE